MKGIVSYRYTGNGENGFQARLGENSSIKVQVI